MASELPTIYDDGDDPYRAIRVGDGAAEGDAAKWGMLLSRFMRIVAVFWLLQGLMQWRVVLAAPQSIFETLPQNAAFAVIFFAVLDLIAGVGLWLATPWGGVLWLLIASAQIFLTLSMPGFFVGGYWLIGVDSLLIVFYFALTFEAGRDVEAQRMRERRKRRKAAEKEAAKQAAKAAGKPPAKPAAASKTPPPKSPAR